MGAPVWLAIFLALSSPSLFSSYDVVSLQLEAPFNDLFDHARTDDEYAVTGTLSYVEGGQRITVDGVSITVRGNTSKRETECAFPKLKVQLPRETRAAAPLLDGISSIKIGTHCGEAQNDALSTKYGRLQNEKSPHREALVYKLLEAAGAPTLRTRPARVTYIDKAQSAPLERNALLLEDDDDAMKRVKGTAELPMESFGSVATRNASIDAARIAFAQALIGNFDWCLKFSPDDIYRCNEPKPLWNVAAFDLGGGKASLLMKDFDLAGVVVGQHKWFDTVWNRGFVPSKSEVEIEVLSQVQRTRSLFTRAQLDAERRHFVEKKPAIDAVLQRAPVDQAGRDIARRYVDAFYKAIENDGEFYRPIVARSDVQVFLDAEGTKEACGPKDVMRPGTPVNEVQKSGAMSQVVILDAMWRWASRNECNAVQDGPVWIRSDAIVSDHPSRN